MKIGEKIEDFEVDAYLPDRDVIERINLRDFEDKWKLLIFYPADFSFVCPTELEDAAKNYEEFKELGCEILSISTDTAFSHKAWHDTSESIGKIKYPMIADPLGKMCKEFDVYIEEGNDEGLALRGSFLIDPDGILKASEINDNSIGRNIKESLRKLKAAQFVREHGKQVCPANWEPGKDTLTPTSKLVGKI